MKADNQPEAPMEAIAPTKLGKKREENAKKGKGNIAQGVGP